jgi:tetratricopeptide (TPR) repeat protein
VAFLSYIQEARDFMFRDKDPVKAESTLRPLLSKPQTLCEKRAVYELMGIILREQSQYAEAARIYQQLGDNYQLGYCAMLQGKTQQMQQAWGKMLAIRQNHWCVALYGLIHRQLRSYPTIFQIRNHMESDIANLIAAKQTDYLENFLSHVDLLTQINLETPKFAGRALMNAGWLNRAGKYLLQGQKTLPNDPEIYFHLGQYSALLNHVKEAKLMLKQCLMISPSYTPASDLLASLPEHTE